MDINFQGNIDLSGGNIFSGYLRTVREAKSPYYITILNNTYTFDPSNGGYQIFYLPNDLVLSGNNLIGDGAMVGEVLTLFNGSTQYFLVLRDTLFSPNSRIVNRGRDLLIGPNQIVSLVYSGIGWSPIDTKPRTFNMEFFSSTTYTIPHGYEFLRVVAVGGGGGGGSGSRGATSTSRTGGAGGSGGSYADTTMRVDTLLDRSLVISIGAGGAGGANNTGTSSAGQSGGAGGRTFVSSSWMRIASAAGGVGGSDGRVGAASVAGGSGSALLPSPAGSGGQGTSSNGGQGSSHLGGGGGGGGAGINSSNVAGTIGGHGGPGSIQYNDNIYVTAKTNAEGDPGIILMAGLAGGGGGGGAPLFPGGAGSRGGGGGGGGASTNDATGNNAGGAGGNGYVMISLW